MIRTVLIRNFRKYRQLRLDLEGLNLLVGRNEAGKSTLLEAIDLALTARVGFRSVSAMLNRNLVNKEAADEYLKSLREGKRRSPPEVVVELYLKEAPETVSLKGTNNELRENCPGVRLWIHFDQEYASEYATYVDSADEITSIPIEYYKCDWFSFAGERITYRGIKVKSSLVDASKIDIRRGTDYYLQKVIHDSLDPGDRIALARAYSDLGGQFSELDGVQSINNALNERKSEITEKQLTLSLDLSSRLAWESSLVPNLDDLPFSYAGGGETNSLKILLALTKRVEGGTHIILVEEPENHLEYSRMSKLVSKIAELCEGSQVVLSTHSSFVLNKLGLRHLVLLGDGEPFTLKNLSTKTQKFFSKLPGYDTLRVLLAPRVILVEGRSDELVVQRAYYQQHSCAPIDNGTDVIAVGGLAFRSFLELGTLSRTNMRVVTDNDGNMDSAKARFSEWSESPLIKVHMGKDVKHPSLESQVISANSMSDLGKIFGRAFDSHEEAIEYFSQDARKAEFALTILESTHEVVMPEYIREAVHEQ